MQSTKKLAGKDSAAVEQAIALLSVALKELEHIISNGFLN